MFDCMSMSVLRGARYVLQTNETGGSERGVGEEEERAQRGGSFWKCVLLYVKLMWPFSCLLLENCELMSKQKEQCCIPS